MGNEVTGIYMRARRDGKWQSLDIAELTRDELTETFRASDKDRVIKGNQ